MNQRRRQIHEPVSTKIENYQKLPHTTANWNDTENWLKRIFQLSMCHIYFTSGRLVVNNIYQEVTIVHYLLLNLNSTYFE